MRADIRALPIFWQTLLLIVMSLVIEQAAFILLLFVEPPPRPEVNRLGDIVETLQGRSHPVASPGRGPMRRDLIVSREPDAPTPPPDMEIDEGFVRTLAAHLDTRPDRVRLFFEPDRFHGSPFGRRPRRPVSVENGEPLFFTPIVAARQVAGGWIVARTPPPPLIAPWQRRMMLWFALSLLALAPIGWLFARALARPIRRIAEAADRLGADPQSPPIAEDGPAELRTTARALNRMQSRLGDYVDERTAMIGAIAHDLRTPLARIAFRVEAAPDTLREKVLGDVEQMRAMLAATIGFVRNTDRQSLRGPTDLSGLVGAVVAEDADLGRPVRMESIAPVTVLGDALALERLVQNLIGNGLAYGGAVEVSVGPMGGQAEVRVSDRGPGLSPDMLTRVFQPFVRGDPSRNRETGGIGLGLTIARTIAEDHGGTVSLHNREGGGLDAVIRLPIA